jgi:hypothetical protein
MSSEGGMGMRIEVLRKVEVVHTQFTAFLLCINPSPFFFYKFKPTPTYL